MDWWKALVAPVVIAILGALGIGSAVTSGNADLAFCQETIRLIILDERKE